MGAKEKVTRFDADLFDAAAEAGARESRSARAQLTYWARLGRAVSDTTSAERLSVERALSGQVPVRALSEPAQAVFHAEVEARIAENLATTDYGKTLAARGVRVVSLDDDGELVEHPPTVRHHAS